MITLTISDGSYTAQVSADEDATKENLIDLFNRALCAILANERKR